jgi:polar amino acid transport system permease protein
MGPTTQAPPRTALANRDSVLARIPWWAVALAGLATFVVFLIANNRNYQDTFLFILQGVIVTLRITLTAFPLATVIGLITGLGRASKNTFFFNLATFYVEIVRGIPLLVIILYFGFALMPVMVDAINALGQWGLSWGGESWFAGLFSNLATFSIRAIPNEMRATLALAFGYGAFEAEVFRAGIQSIGRGQMEAARSLGMSYMQAMRYIILPQAIRRVLPPLGNDFIALLKDSSLATVLAVPESSQMTKVRVAATFRTLEGYNTLAFLYLSMTLLLSAGVRLLEKLMRYEE